MKTIYQDDHILVIDKPAGIAVLSDGWDRAAPYLAKMLEQDFGKIWVVHRLDKITSGAMIFARDPESHRALNLQFRDHEVEKTYHAILDGNPPWEERIAEHPLRVNVGHKHRTMVDDLNGKPSETRFRILKRFEAAALVEAKPMTGRTHQVRVHAYALGHPLLGDILYGGRETDLIARAALHALALIVTHPHTNERMTFTAEYPQDFATALKFL